MKHLGIGRRIIVGIRRRMDQAYTNRLNAKMLVPVLFLGRRAEDAPGQPVGNSFNLGSPLYGGPGEWLGYTTSDSGQLVSLAAPVTFLAAAAYPTPQGNLQNQSQPPR